MTLGGPGFLDPIYRMQPIEEDRNDEESADKRRRRVVYQGRSYSESEEEIPVSPPHEPPKSTQRNVYADEVLVARAEKLFSELTTLEEKTAQLCFYETSAIYDTEAQNLLETVIVQGQIGGLLFIQGDHRRQSFLIDWVQKLSKTPLLIGNTFLQGLSFYFQGPPPATLFDKGEKLTRFTDLGKAVMKQNRSIGVHFQCDREQSQGAFPSEEAAKAFRVGIREARGFVGKDGRPRLQENVGFKTLFLYDLNTHQDVGVEAFFQSPFDAVVGGIQVLDFIAAITTAVREGRVREEDIDRRVRKILLMKAHVLR